MSAVIEGAGLPIWIEALESGRHPQGTGCLGDDDCGFCCLGVGARCAVDAGVIDDDGYNSEHTNLHMLGIVVRWLGLRTSGGDYDDGDLMILNDNKKLTFVEIATKIRENPPGLLTEAGQRALAAMSSEG